MWNTPLFFNHAASKQLWIVMKTSAITHLSKTQGQTTLFLSDLHYLGKLIPLNPWWGFIKDFIFEQTAK